ncbi:hypothetical protein P7C73_g4079, partial [Tremellales sp. Uapishka_1]
MLSALLDNTQAQPDPPNPLTPTPDLKVAQEPKDATELSVHHTSPPAPYQPVTPLQPTIAVESSSTLNTIVASPSITTQATVQIEVQALSSQSHIEQDVEMTERDEAEASDVEVDGEREDEAEAASEADVDSDEEGEEEEEEEDEEEDEDSSGEESEDLEHSPKLYAVAGPEGVAELQLPVNIQTVKTEPLASDGQAGDSQVPFIPTEGQEPVTEPPKKKRRKQRSPSEDEDLPPPPPPMKTIRLEREMLPEGQTLDWDVLEEARDKGMVAGWERGEEMEPFPGDKMDIPLPTTHAMELDINASVGEREAQEMAAIAARLEAKYKDPPRKKTKVIKRNPDYNFEDPFIDDSELLIDAPTHYQRPKKEGFFVHSGPLELLEASPKKAKAKATSRKSLGGGASEARPKRISIATLTASKYGIRALPQVEESRAESSKAEGSRSSPIKIDSDFDVEIVPRAGPSTLKSPEKDMQANVPLDREVYIHASKTSRLLPPWPAFPSVLAQSLKNYRAQALECKYL